MKKLPVVYLAGPYRALTPWLVEYNCRVAEEATLALMKLGVPVITPHLIGRNFDKEVPDDLVLGIMQELMLKCDVVVVLPDYAKSAGTKAEIELAKRHEMPVLFMHEHDNMHSLVEALHAIMR